MNYLEAKKQVVQKRIIGGIIALVAGCLTTVGLVKSFYVQISVLESQGLGILSGIKNLIAGLYYLPYFPRFLWPASPVIDLQNVISYDNLPFLFVYLLSFVGAAILGSANNLSRKLKSIKQKLLDLELEHSMMGDNPSPSPRKFEEVVKNVPIESESFFKQFHSLYLAPIIVAVIIWLLKIG